MAKYTVGSVPYVNAIPLTYDLERWKEEVHVLYAVPSQLPAMLETGEADAILVSSVDALRTPGRRMAAGTCIGSDGPVKSVRLFSKVPPKRIRRLALDASSMTSNRLAQILLADGYGVRDLELVTRPPDLAGMLEDCDAGVLIGDIGMTTDGTGLHVLDMGEEWKRLTGKPFVWAAWIGGERLTPRLALHLYAAARQSHVGRDLVQESVGGRVSRLLMRKWYREMDATIEEAAGPKRERLIAHTVERAGWSEAAVRDYYMNVMVYEMDDRMLEGLREFQRRLLANGFADAHHFPEIVDPAMRD
ncbi:MAG: menaquinone biosynthetic enzyme MqnA/MqnD family protein [Fimbriimonas sp.]